MKKRSRVRQLTDMAQAMLILSKYADNTPTNKGVLFASQNEICVDFIDPTEIDIEDLKLLEKLGFRYCSSRCDLFYPTC